jgi:hypothetical protein
MVVIIVISWRFYLWKKPKYPEKITDLVTYYCIEYTSQLYHIIFIEYISGFELATLVVIGTDCTTTTAPASIDMVTQRKYGQLTFLYKYICPS